MKNEKMKKFFLLNIILCFFIIFLLYLINISYKNYTNSLGISYFNVNKNNVKVMNLGSSHTYFGIKYPEDILSYNLAMAAQNFYYDLKVLEKYSKNLDQECVIIIPISIFSFYRGEKLDDIKFNYIDILERKDILNLSYPEYILGKYFFAVQSSKRLKQGIEYFFKSLLKKSEAPTKILYQRDLTVLEKEKEAKVTAKEHLYKWNESKRIGIIQLKKLLKFAENNNFRPILITTPQTYLYNEQIGEENYQERIYNNILEVEKQLGKKYLYLDYSHDERFEKKLEYFFDDDHLNEKGAEYFTKILLQDLKNKGYTF